MFHNARSRAGETLSADIAEMVAIFRRSHAQHCAIHQLVVDCVWATLKEGTPTFEIEPFLTAIVESLHLFGYALFRKGVHPIVADASQIYLERNSGVFRPRLLPGHTSLKGTKWHLVVLDPPVVAGGKRPVTVAVNSCARRSMNHSQTLDELIFYRRQRNMFNSQPTVFMSGESRADAVVAGAATDYDQLMQNRLRFYKDSAEVDAQLVRNQAQNGNTVGYIPRVAGGLEPARNPDHQAHAELRCSLGLTPTAARHLDTDVREAEVTRDLTYAVYDAYHVPPGKFGLNRNTERMAGNLIVSQQPMHVYSQYINRLVDILNAVLSVCAAGVTLTPALDPGIIQMLQPLMVPAVAAKLLAHAHGIPVASFDLAQFSDEVHSSHEKKSVLERANDALTP
jgi:hypothetical protein